MQAIEKISFQLGLISTWFELSFEVLLRRVYEWESERDWKRAGDNGERNEIVEEKEWERRRERETERKRDIKRDWHGSN